MDSTADDEITLPYFTVLIVYGKPRREEVIAMCNSDDWSECLVMATAQEQVIIKKQAVQLALINPLFAHEYRNKITTFVHNLVRTKSSSPTIPPLPSMHSGQNHPLAQQGRTTSPLQCNHCGEHTQSLMTQIVLWSFDPPCAIDVIFPVCGADDECKEKVMHTLLTYKSESCIDQLKKAYGESRRMIEMIQQRNKAR